MSQVKVFHKCLNTNRNMNEEDNMTPKGTLQYQNVNKKRPTKFLKEFKIVRLFKTREAKLKKSIDGTDVKFHWEIHTFRRNQTETLKTKTPPCQIQHTKIQCGRIKNMRARRQLSETSDKN